MDTTWFTPTTLFCLVNLMILVIFLASYSKSHNPNNPQLGHTNSPQFARSSSILARVKSFNFSLNRFDSHYPFQPETRLTDPLQNHETEIDYSYQVSEHQLRPPATTEDIPLVAVKKSASEKTVNGRADEEEEVLARRPATTGDIPVATMKKSASEKKVAVAESEREEEVVVQRPATVREKTSRLMERAVSKTVSFKEDVDAKADDFINRFKQQLKLQKLDSIKRYTDMLSRGTGATISS